MKVKTNRLETLKLLISSGEYGSQEEVLTALKKEGFTLTQATLSRDLKQLNETMYKRIHKPLSAAEMMMTPGFISINFSGNIAVIKTRPGYASSIAYNIDTSEMPEILGTIAGDDTIIVVIKEGVSHEEVTESLSQLMPGF